MLKFTVPRMFDAHVHPRDGEVMESVIGYTAAQCSSFIMMPNLAGNPLTDTRKAIDYLSRIATQVGAKSRPRVALYLTENFSSSEFKFISNHNDKAGYRQIIGLKLYPYGVTTNSSDGVKDIDKCAGTLCEMEKHGIPLLIHGESSHPSDDPFDREKLFLSNTLRDIRRIAPSLKIVLEHITTREAVECVLADTTGRLAATITAHHLLLDRTDLLGDKLNPHLFCKPIVKRREDRLALLDAIKSGSDRFFAGTDSAPHTTDKKECACGCAGCFTAPIALELYTQAFFDAFLSSRFDSQRLLKPNVKPDVDDEHIRRAMETAMANFLSLNAHKFYDARNTFDPDDVIDIISDPHPVDSLVTVSDGSTITPLLHGENINFRAIPRT